MRRSEVFMACTFDCGATVGLGAYRIPSETGFLIPSGFANYVATTLILGNA
jgi:hypothetical protein